MRGRAFRSLSFTFALLLIALSVTADDIQLPDSSKGQINGKRAMLVWPVSGVQIVGESGAKPNKLLSPDGCSVYLVPTDDLERELIYPCGKWFLPPAGRYRVWLEGSNLATGDYGIVSYDAEPFAGRGLAMMMPLEPAGRVALSKNITLRPETSFRLLQIRGPARNGVLLGPFDRRVRNESAHTGVQMGAGSVLAGIFDRKSNEAIALSRPVTVTTGKISTVSVLAPTKGTDIMAILDRPRVVKVGEEEVALTLDLGGVSRKPDVFMNTSTRVYAVWYGVDGRTAAVRVQSAALRYNGPVVVLRPQKVVTVRGKLEKLPTVGVSIRAPVGVLADAKTWLEVRGQHSRDALRTIPARLNESVRLEALPAEPLNIILIAGPWEFSRSVDLTSGADDDVAFDLQPIVVSGIVYYGRDPSPGAEVAFEADRDWIRTKSSEEGRYELAFWRPAWDYRAEVRVRDRAGPPFIDGLFDIKENSTIDFHVPRTRFTVDVLDAVTRKPVEGAKVLGGNSWSARGGSDAVQTSITDATGRAHLQPMREGTMVVRARADGYLDSEPIRRTVDRIDDEGHMEIALRPVGETIRVRLRMRGRDASGASVWAVRSTEGQQPPLWRGIAGADGVVEIPRSVREASFLVRHDGAASTIHRIADEKDVAWDLEPAAPPVVLKTQKQARLALWIGGMRVSGVALRFLTGSMEATDSSGTWSAQNLPATPLRVLAWHGASASQIEAGAYDAIATRVDYPWPSVVEIPTVD